MGPCLFYVFICLLGMLPFFIQAQKCCETCTVKNQEKYYSIDTRFNQCGECCMDPADFNLYKKFEKGLEKANSSTPCLDLGYPTYLETETHGSLGITMTLDMYAAVKDTTTKSLKNRSAATRSNSSKRVMTWLCLEFCQETQESIQQNLKQIILHRNVFDAISFEKYTLGPNSTLVDNQLTVVAPQIVSLGLEAWPLLSSYPHPPEFIDWMRTVFTNPHPFIDACISEANKYHYTGYNLDWEPTDDVTADDAVAYAQFIQVFSDRLHRHNLLLSVDIATWSVIWNYPLIAETSVDRGISMGTYTSNDASFERQLLNLTTSFPVTRAGVGLMTTNASSGALLPLSEVDYRFKKIVDSGVQEIDLWCSPVPEDWFPLLEEFKQT